MVELVFLMLIMKLPILYLAGVCYWAIKAEPRPPEGARLTVPAEPAPWTPVRVRSRPQGPHGRPQRREARAARGARAPSPS